MVALYQPSQQLRNISEKKYFYYKNKIIKTCNICKDLGQISCDRCMLLEKVYSRYKSANIPFDFWDKTMATSFCGDINLKNIYDEITTDIDDYFNKGQSYIFLGMHGCGKTFISSMILKKIVEKGYDALYTTLSDIIGTTTCSDYSERRAASRELQMIDFLVIDEFDPRFFSSDASAELFGRIAETVIRIRFQNKLPTILVTNNPDPAKAFGEALGASINSLIGGYCKKVFITGADKRKVL